ALNTYMSIESPSNSNQGDPPLRGAGGLLIYTVFSSPRLRYVFDLIFLDLLGVEYTITHDADRFAYSNDAKFSYAEKPTGNELFFFSTSLLFEKGVHSQDINVFEWKDTKAFFATHPNYAMPFDPFAAS